MRIETPSFGFELVRRFLHLPQKYPTKIQVEITNRCNLTCEICPRTTYNLPNRDMTPTRFQQILSKLPNAEVILPVGWGESFLHKKIDIIIAKSSVANILRRNGLPPSPERKGLSWREFLSRHAAVFLCADLFQKEVWTFRGMTTAYVFFVIHLQTRKVILARATFSPTNQWLKQQTRNVLWECEDQGIKPRFFLRDNDSLYPKEMNMILKSSGVETVRTPFQAPNANAHAERYVLNCKENCLNHLISSQSWWLR